MPVRPRLRPTAYLWAAALAAATAACAGDGSRATIDDRFVGILTVQQSAGQEPALSLDRDGRACLPLLATPAAARQARRLDGKSVAVTGRTMARPPAAADVLSVDVDGRAFHPGLCQASAEVLVVDALTRAR